MLTSIFHIMQSDSRVVALRMQADGTHDPVLNGKPVEEAWPLYGEAAPLVGAFFDQSIGRAFKSGRQIVRPGNGQYPRALAQALCANKSLRLWAYVSAVALWVSYRQVAAAMLLRAPTARLRQELETKGVRFSATPHGHYKAALGQVAQVLGEEVADDIYLYPRQAGEFLGLSSRAAAFQVSRLGIAAHREDMALVRWGLLRRVRRVGPRKFEVLEQVEAA